MSMTQQSKERQLFKRPFDVFIPMTSSSPAIKAETIEVEVYVEDGEEILTQASLDLIERRQVHHMALTSAIARMQAVPVDELLALRYKRVAYHDGVQAIRARLILAAKGETP